MARPEIELTEEDWGTIERCAQAHCPLVEIAARVGVSESTLTRRIQDAGFDGFGEFSKQMRATGNSLLREQQLNSVMKGSVPMQKFLGKNWLGQSERVDIQINAFDQMSRDAGEKIPVEDVAGWEDDVLED